MSAPVDDLLERAFTDPAGVLEEATERLPAATDGERGHLLRAMGNACRELRRVDESVEHLREAVAVATRLGDAELEGVCSMSLAASLSYSGDFDASMRVGRRAVELVDGDDRIAAMSQLAGVLQRVGRNDEARRLFTEALVLAEHSADRTLVVNLWANRGVLRGWAGEIDAAEEDTARALAVIEQQGWTKWAADLRHNLAWLAGRRGDLVEAFRRFDAAERTYESLGLTGASVFPDRCETLLAAGLTNEALALAERAAAGLRAQGADVD
nr:tetratricopeptide repeat protein [Acidimicrobiia bacterium]